MKSLKKFGIFKLRGMPVVAISSRYVETVNGVNIYKAEVLQMSYGWSEVTLRKSAAGPFRTHWIHHQEPTTRRNIYLAHYELPEGSDQEYLTYASHDKNRAIGIMKGQLRKRMSKLMGVE